MRNFNEWRAEATEHENPSILLDKLNQLVHQLELEMNTFQGDRFEGFLNLIGSVKGLQRTLAEIAHNCVGDSPKAVTAEDCAGQPSKPRKMEKIKHKEVISKGVRKGENDLSSDYKGHIKKNGEVEPFKVL